MPFSCIKKKKNTYQGKISLFFSFHFPDKISVHEWLDSNAEDCSMTEKKLLNMFMLFNNEGIDIIPGKHKYPDISIINLQIRTERLNAFRAVDNKNLILTT